MRAGENTWGWAGSKSMLETLPAPPSSAPRTPGTPLVLSALGGVEGSCRRPGASPVHHESGGVVAHGGRVQCPPAAGQLAGLDRVVAHGGQPVTSRLPGQQHAARLHVLLLHHRLAGGLGAVCEVVEGDRSRGVSQEGGEGKRRRRLIPAALAPFCAHGPDSRHPWLRGSSSVTCPQLIRG